MATFIESRSPREPAIQNQGPHGTCYSQAVARQIFRVLRLTTDSYNIEFLNKFYEIKEWLINKHKRNGAVTTDVMKASILPERDGGLPSRLLPNNLRQYLRARVAMLTRTGATQTTSADHANSHVASFFMKLSGPNSKIVQ